MHVWNICARIARRRGNQDAGECCGRGMLQFTGRLYPLIFGAHPSLSAGLSVLRERENILFHAERPIPSR